MKLVRFRTPDDGSPKEGELRGDAVIAGDSIYRFDRVALLPPCVPTKIVCVGRNYAAHARELGNVVPKEPLFFFKPPSAVIGPDEGIVLPESPQVDYEAELAVVIGRRCRNVPPERALEFVLGYTCMNDVTDRAAQRWEQNWVRAKGFDTSAPLGPAILTRDETDGPFHITLRLNGILRQDGTTELMICPVPRLIAMISSIMTLEPGDVIATGTPAGVGPLSPGDTVEITIDGIGTLRNRVRAPGQKELG